MKNLVGGLFETQEHANLAYEALERSGFHGQEIHMLIHKPRSETAQAANVSVQDIGKVALAGGLVGGLIGGFAGFLVGTGAIPLPYLDRVSESGTSMFMMMAVFWGLLTGGLTGIILGVASRLLRSPEKAEVMTRKILERGVLVTVDVSDSQGETRAQNILQEHHAVEVGDPRKKWDMDLWVSPNEKVTSMAAPR